MRDAGKLRVLVALCLILLFSCTVAEAKIDVQVTKSEANISIDSDAGSVVSASHTYEINAKIKSIDLTLVPEFHYGSEQGAEINLQHSYVRIPFGIWSIYGGTQTVATSFYYQKFGQGFFAGLAHDKENNKEILLGMRDATTFTTGIVLPKRGRNKDMDIKLSFSNAHDIIARTKYQTWSLESERKLSNGHKISYSISNNNRILRRQNKVNYDALSIGYERKFREGFTAKLTFGLSHSHNNSGNFKQFRPFVQFKLSMQL